MINEKIERCILSKEEARERNATGYFNPANTYTYVDSRMLQQFIEQGDISERELVDFIKGSEKGKTLDEKIKHFEEEHQWCLKNDPEFYTMGRTGYYPSLDKKDTILKAKNAREGYIPLSDHCSCIIEGEDRERLLEDYLDWIDSLGYFDIYDQEEKKNRPYNSERDRERFKSNLINIGRDRCAFAGDISLEYPALNHGFRTDGVYNSEVSKWHLNHTWYGHHLTDLPGKIGIEVDLLSALRVMNRFKDKGYKVTLKLDDYTQIRAV